MGLLVIIPLNLYYAEMLLLDKTAQNIPYVFINIFSEKKKFINPERFNQLDLGMGSEDWGTYIFSSFPRKLTTCEDCKPILSLPSVWDPLGRSQNWNYRLLTPSVHRVHLYVKLLGVFTICSPSKKNCRSYQMECWVTIGKFSALPLLVNHGCILVINSQSFSSWIIIQFACNLCVRFAQLLAHISH